MKVQEAAHLFKKNGVSVLFTGTVFVTVATIVNSFFSYLLQIFLGQRLSIADYGTYNALLSLFSIIGILKGGFPLSILKVVSEQFGKKNYAVLTQLFWDLVKWFLLFGIFSFLVLVTFRTSIADYLSISETGVIICFALYVMLSNLTTMPNTYLRGYLLFNTYGLFMILAGLLRFSLPAFIVLLGYSVEGVYFGISVSQIILFTTGFLVLRKYFKKGTKENLKKYYDKILSFSIPAYIVFFGTTIFNNIDIVLVKRFFEAETAGLYSGVVTIGKIILFGTGAVTVVMFPKISALKSENKDYFKKFKIFLALLILMIAPAYLIFSLFPEFITTLFFGSRFLPSAKYLSSYALFISLYVLVNFMIMFYLAIEKVKVLILLVFTALAQFILINLCHESISQVIGINAYLMGALLISLFIYLLKIKPELINKSKI